jgi:hypothetical protein
MIIFISTIFIKIKTHLHKYIIILKHFTPFNNSNADFYNKKKEFEKLEKGT